MIRICYPKTYYMRETTEPMLAERRAIVVGVASDDIDVAGGPCAHLVAEG